ncbi:hypothetical protein BDF19DRAFT_424116 [Syncephalis fuscata]|nr:hypothetical protein BDF19DRAFT_424116 [Syncephalis fuscata]
MTSPLLPYARCDSPVAFNNENNMGRDTQRITEVCQQFFLNEEMPAGHLWQWSVSELYGVMIGMFRRLGIFPDTMPVAEGALIAFLDDVCAGYLENPYHSFAHGADVASVVYDFLHMPHAMTWLTPLDRVSMMISALCHDIGHPGLNNVYQVNANTNLAQQYKQESVLERYSCDVTADLLRKHDLLRWIPQSFADMETQGHEEESIAEKTDSDNTAADSKEKRTPADYIYKRINDTILYTDMKFHFELLDQLHHLVDELHGCDVCEGDEDDDEDDDALSTAAEEEEMEREEDSMTSDNDDDTSSVNSDKLFGPSYLESQLSRQSSDASEQHNTSATASGPHTQSTTTHTPADMLPTVCLSPAQRSTLCSIILHAADISNTARPWAVFKWWSHSINTEFRHQNQRERDEGLPLSPGLDRPADEEMTGNIEFAELVRPFFVGLSELIPEMRPFLQNLDANVQRLRVMENAKRNAHSKSPLSPLSPRRIGERRVSLAAGHLLVPADWQNRLIRRRNTLAHMVTRRSSLRRTLSRPGFMTSSRSSSIGASATDVTRGYTGGGRMDQDGIIDRNESFILTGNITHGIPTTLRPSLVMRTNSEAELRAHRLRRATVPCSTAYNRPSADAYTYCDPRADELEHRTAQHLSQSLMADVSAAAINYQINEDYVMQPKPSAASTAPNPLSLTQSLAATLPLLSENTINDAIYPAMPTVAPSSFSSVSSSETATASSSITRHSVPLSIPAPSSSLRESRRGSAVAPLSIHTAVSTTEDHMADHRHTKSLRIDTATTNQSSNGSHYDYEHLSSATPTSDLFSPTSTHYLQEEDINDHDNDLSTTHCEASSPRDALTNLCLRTLSRAARALSWLPLTVNAQYRSPLAMSKPSQPTTPTKTPKSAKTASLHSRNSSSRSAQVFTAL